MEDFQINVKKQRPIYEQLIEESDKAYAAFLVYRDMGRKRSVPSAYRTATGRIQAKQANGQWNLWADKFTWRKRAEAWDRHLDQRLDQQLDQEIHEMASRHAKIARALQEKLVRRMLTIDPDTLSPQDVIKWYDIAVKREREALGVADARLTRPVEAQQENPQNYARESDDDTAFNAEQIARLEQFYIQDIYSQSSAVVNAERDDYNSRGEISLQTLPVPIENSDGSLAEENYS